MTLIPSPGKLREHAEEIAAKPKVDPREPDYSRMGIFPNHNCSRCDNGRYPCVVGTPNRCEFPHARND